MNEHGPAINSDSRWASVAGTVAVALVSGVALASAALMTRVDFFKTGDEGGWWHARVLESCLLVLPVAAVLFAHGPAWWRRGLRVRAAFALAAFPAWAIALRTVDTVIANDTWVAVVLLPLQGIQPFGAPQ